MHDGLNKSIINKYIITDFLCNYINWNMIKWNIYLKIRKKRKNTKSVTSLVKNNKLNFLLDRIVLSIYVDIQMNVCVWERFIYYNQVRILTSHIAWALYIYIIKRILLNVITIMNNILVTYTNHIRKPHLNNLYSRESSKHRLFIILCRTI